VRRRRRDDTAHDTNDGRTLIFTLTHCGGAVQGRDAMKAIGEATAVTAQLGRLKQQRPRSTRDGVSGREARPLLTQQLRRALTAAAASGTRAPPEEAPIRRGASARGYAQHTGRGQAGQRLDRAVLRRALAVAVLTVSRFAATVVCRWQRTRLGRTGRRYDHHTIAHSARRWALGSRKTSSMRSFFRLLQARWTALLRVHTLRYGTRCPRPLYATTLRPAVGCREERLAAVAVAAGSRTLLGGRTLQNLRLTRSCIRVFTSAGPAR
jgi:hypothetical protein